MKNIKLLMISYVLGGLSLITCRNEDNRFSSNAQKYLLKEQNIVGLSAFSTNFNIKNINVNNINDFAYDIKVVRLEGEYGKEEVIENFKIKVNNESLTISTFLFSEIYKIEKNISLDKMYFKKGNEVFEITNKFIDNLKGNDEYVLKRLLALYIELYDNNIKKYSVSDTVSFAEQKACAEFESHIGFTASAARFRAEYDAKEFIADGHSDCRIIGTDVSCALDSHICFATTTMACSGSTCN